MPHSANVAATDGYSRVKMKIMTNSDTIAVILQNLQDLLREMADASDRWPSALSDTAARAEPKHRAVGRLATRRAVAGCGRAVRRRTRPRQLVEVRP